jgi:alcohol dehydrogenase class IV
LRRVNINPKDIDAMAKDACGNRRLMGPNPVELSEQDAADVYRRVLRV